MLTASKGKRIGQKQASTLDYSAKKIFLYGFIQGFLYGFMEISSYFSSREDLKPTDGNYFFSAANTLSN